MIRLLTALSLCLAAAHGTDREPPNIVWLIGENLTSGDLACYGGEHVYTPHLDGLAREGVRYTNVFATNPACAPSRSAFFIGMYQTTTDTHPMRSHRGDSFRLPEGVRCITHRLRDAGYFTANIKTVGGASVGTGKLDLNFVNEGPIFHENSSEWNELKAKQPFFAVVNSEENEYDITEDIHEIHNLLESPDPLHQDALTRMRAALDTRIIETGDRGAFPEARDIVAPFAGEMHEWFGTPRWVTP